MLEFEIIIFKAQSREVKGHLKSPFYYATIAYHVGLNAVLRLPHPGPTS